MADQNTTSASDAAYWAANVRIILISLVIWAVVSFGFGILLRPMLAGIAVGGESVTAAESVTGWRSIQPDSQD